MFSAAYDRATSLYREKRRRSKLGNDSYRQRSALLRSCLMDWMDINATSLTSDLMVSMQ
jgi:hypothetical protein